MVAQMTALVSPAGSPCPSDDPTWAVLVSQAEQQISASFADPAKSRLLALLLRDGNRQTCAIAGGVDSYKPGSQSVHGNSATLEAEVGQWARFHAAGQPGSVEPHNVKHCAFTLVREGSTWLVSDFKCQFVPGHGP